MNVARRKSVGLFLAAWGMIAGVAVVRLQAGPRPNGAIAQTQASGVSVGADNVGGVVASANGPEAGVWVIAETNDFQTKFRKIVVTDDRGRYLIPDLPKANYKIWVRGYGLVDSQPVDAKPGQTLALTAVAAPSPAAAAQYYPPNYWYSMLQIPPKDAFPMTVPGQGSFLELHTGRTIQTQADYIWGLRRGCEVCHQMGTKATREVSRRSAVSRRSGKDGRESWKSARAAASCTRPRPWASAIPRR